MLHLLSPAAGFLTLLTLGVPLLLHLWRPPARTVRLGSLRFLHAAASRRRNLRWRERALLLARLALLSLLAVLLARPRWRSSPPAGPQRWALLSPDSLSPSGEPLARLRSLRAAGYEVHCLAPGLPPVDLTRVNEPSPADDDAPPLPDLWSLLREADARLPAGSTLAVFAPGRLASLRGERPTLSHCRVEWIATTPGPAAESWLDRFTLAADSREARALIGSSDATTVRWLPASFVTTVAPPRLPLPAANATLETRPVSGMGLAARLVPADDHRPPGPWTQAQVKNPLRVTLFTSPARAGDSRFLAAAIQAATPGVLLTRLPAEPPPAGAPPADWTFWLSDTPVPATISEATAARGASLFTETGDDATPVPALSTIVPAAADAPGAEALAAVPVRLWQRGPAPVRGVTWWQDSSGAPLLTASTLGHGRHWHFASRLDPAWSDLAAGSALPATLRSLLQTSEPASAGEHDRRLTDPTQSRVVENPHATNPNRPAPPPDLDPGADLHGFVWVLAALAFGLERVLSRRSPSPAVVAVTNA